jgi:putative transcriptional regulator
MSEVYESLMEGLKEALAFAKCEKAGAIVHQIDIRREALRSTR